MIEEKKLDSQIEYTSTQDTNLSEYIKSDKFKSTILSEYKRLTQKKAKYSEINTELLTKYHKPKAIKQQGSAIRYFLPLTNFEKKSISDLKLGQNPNSFIEANITETPFSISNKYIKLNILISDDNKTFSIMKIQNVSSDDMNRIDGAKKIYLKNPFLKLGKNGVHYIKAFNSYQYIIEDSKFVSSGYEQTMQNYLKIKKEAGSDFEKANYRKALEKYVKGLLLFVYKTPSHCRTIDDFYLDFRSNLDNTQFSAILTEFSKLFSNISVCYLLSEDFAIAYQYGLYSKFCDSNFSKSNLRITESLVRMGHVYEARNILKTLGNETDPSLKQKYEELMNECNKTIEKMQSDQIITDIFMGKFDIDLNTCFLGPLKLQNSDKKGRGMFATEDIPSGTTLFIEKGKFFPTEIELCIDIVKKMNDKRSEYVYFDNLYPSLTNLLSGELFEKKSDVNEHFHDLKNELDEFRRKKDITWRNLCEIDVDNCLLKVILNAFSTNDMEVLFRYLSLFNHSCRPNTNFFVVNEIVYLKSIKDIKQGEEIEICYKNQEEDSKSRRLVLLNEFGFECNCIRCTKEFETEDFLVCNKCQKKFLLSDSGIDECCKITQNQVKKLNEAFETYKQNYAIDHKLEKKLIIGKDLVSDNNPLRQLINLGLCSINMEKQEKDKFINYYRDAVNEIKKLPTRAVFSILTHIIFRGSFYFQEYVEELTDAVKYFGMNPAILLKVLKKN